MNGEVNIEAHFVLSRAKKKGAVTPAEFNLKSDGGKEPGAMVIMGIASTDASVAASGATDARQAHYQLESVWAAKSLPKWISFG